jgi:hypothetical protein
MKDQIKPIKKTMEERIEAFVQVAKAAEDSFKQACQMLFEMRQDYPAAELYAKIRQRVPIPESFLDRMCEAAQGRFPARLLLYPSPGATYLQKLSFDKAVQHSEGDLPVVIPDEKGFNTDYKRFHELTVNEVRQVFDGDRVRGAKEQTSWLSRQRLRQAEPAQPPEPFEIVDGYVLFKRDFKMTVDEVELLLGRLRKSQSE